jgi:hypothetical protein
MDNRLTIHVFELAEGNVARVVAGEEVGTIIATPAGSAGGEAADARREDRAASGGARDKEG